MNSSAPQKIDFRQIFETLKTYRWLWISPTIVMALASVGYAIVMPRKWMAKQSFLVREEVGNNLRGLGRFDSTEAMKTAQETILELTRNRDSVATALKSIGPPEKYKQPENWPTNDDVADGQGAISVIAPNGTEFGKTEVIYIAVTAENKARAVTFLTAVSDGLEHRLREIRHRKMQSIAMEVEKRADIVRAEQDEATKRLQQFEAEVGSDLGELRTLSEAGGGDSNLRHQQTAIRNDLRQATNQRESWLQLSQLIDAAQKDPDNFLATPSRLLDSQPGLRRIKESIVDMQSQYARLAGMMSANHPRVKEAMNAEREMRDNLFRELKEAQRGVASDLQANAAQLRSLEQQLANVNERLNQLAGLRAKYVNLVAEVRRCTETFEKTNKELSDARAAARGALSTSLITALDAPTANDRAIGPGRSVIALGGTVGGLAIGLGLVFLIAPLNASGSRWTNYLPFGRRRSDQLASQPGGAAATRASDLAIPGGRRASDPPPPAVAASLAAQNGQPDRRNRRASDRDDRSAPTPHTPANTTVEAPTPPANPAPVAVVAAPVTIEPTKTPASSPASASAAPPTAPPAIVADTSAPAVAKSSSTETNPTSTDRPQPERPEQRPAPRTVFDLPIFEAIAKATGTNNPTTTATTNSLPTKPATPSPATAPTTPATAADPKPTAETLTAAAAKRLLTDFVKNNSPSSTKSPAAPLFPPVGPSSFDGSGTPVNS